MAVLRIASRADAGRRAGSLARAGLDQPQRMQKGPMSAPSVQCHSIEKSGLQQMQDIDQFGAQQTDVNLGR